MMIYKLDTLKCFAGYENLIIEKTEIQLYNKYNEI